MSMIFALMTTFMAPVVVLMWLLIKKKAKSVLFLFLIGAMAFFAGYIVLVVPLEFFVFSKEAYNTFAQNHFYLSSLISTLDLSLAMVVPAIVFMYIIKPGGITFNRCIAFSVGYYGIYNAYSYGIKYITNFTLMESIQNDTLADKYPNASAESLEEITKSITDASAFQYLAEGTKHVLLYAIGMAIVLSVVLGMINKKIVPVALKMFGYICVWIYAYNIVEHYIHPAAAIPVIVVGVIPAILTIKKISKNPKDVMIKPEAMQML